MPWGRENLRRKARLATHLIVRRFPNLPQKSANAGQYHGNDKGGEGKEGDGV